MACAMTSSSSTIRTFAILTPIMENAELEAERGRRLLEESSEIVLVVDEDDRLIAASRRARETLDGLVPGQAVPAQLLQSEPWRPRRVPVEVDGTRESLLYLREPGELAAYEELRAGFTAAVSHELRTPLARLLELDDEAEVPLRPRMLRVVIENLAENTIRYAGDGVTFSISVTRAGDDVVVVAADDGVGVSPADLPRLFERFYRADRARASRGTGLGLAIVK